MTKQIPLTRGQIALVDDNNFDWLSRFKWYCVQTSKYGFYVACKKDRNKLIFMHRLIMNAPKGIDVDHVNRDGLDNRRCNLRLATRSQNEMNRGMQRNNKSGYKGVHWDKKNRAWRAQIVINKEQKILGSFSTKEEAALAYNEAAKTTYGAFAFLNEILRK